MLYDSKVLKNVKLTYDIRSQNTSGISEKILRDSVNKEDSCKIQNKKLGYWTTSEFETPVGKWGRGVTNIFKETVKIYITFIRALRKYRHTNDTIEMSVIYWLPVSPIMRALLLQ